MAGVAIAPHIMDPHASVSPDDTRIAYSDSGQLKILDLPSGQVTRLTAAGRDSYEPDWSPDGNQLVYNFDSNPPVDPSIYVITIADGAPSRLTPWETVERSPAWSPDGKWIVFASDQAKIGSPAGSFLGATELYVMDSSCLADALTCVQSLRQISDMGLEGSSHNPSWAPDAQSLVFSCGTGETDTYQWDLCTVGVDGADLVQLTHTPEDEVRPAWSPDGRYIAFTRNDPSTGRGDIWMWVVDDGQFVNITDTPSLDEAFVFWMNIQ